MEFTILGSIGATRDGQALPLGTPKQRALLGRLLLSPDRVVGIDRLVDDLWGDEPPRRAQSSLQVYVARLRRLLDPGLAAGAARRLITEAPGYRLRVSPDELDALRFERLAAEAAEALPGHPGKAADLAELALACWRGPLLADLEEAFVVPERTRLELLRTAAVDVQLTAWVRTGREGAALADLEALLEHGPLHEGRWELLMLALHRSGRSAEALQRYQQARRVLDEEAGLEPGPGLRALEAAILRQDPELLARAAGDAARITPPPTRTPTAARRTTGGGPDRRAAGPVADAGGLVGRSDELAVLREVLAEALTGRTRWAVVAGEAGIGKTSLQRRRHRRDHRDRLCLPHDDHHRRRGRRLGAAALHP